MKKFKKFKKCAFCKSCIIKLMACTDVRIDRGIVSDNFSCKYFIIDKGS